MNAESSLRCRINGHVCPGANHFFGPYYKGVAAVSAQGWGNSCLERLGKRMYCLCVGPSSRVHFNPSAKVYGPDVSMKRLIRITAGSVTALAELHRTKTADEIWRALPLRGKVNTWGEEIYFGIPVKLELEHGQSVVDLGSLGYWPTGNAFCIFFGPTPMSSGGKIRPASAVSVFGTLLDDPKIFKSVQDGEKIAVERVEKPPQGKGHEKAV